MIELSIQDIQKMCRSYETKEKICINFENGQCKLFKKMCIIQVFRERELKLTAHHIIKCYCGEYLFFSLPDGDQEIELIEILSKKDHQCSYYASICSKINANKFLNK